MSKTTKGPWHVKETFKRHEDGSITLESTSIISGDGIIASDVSEDAARLIAAAPDLFQACQNLMLLVKDPENSPICRIALAAIVKAEVQS